VDDHYGMQPMRIKSLPDYWLICNGEIYNCQRLAEQYGYKYETKCDVEAILHNYEKGGIEFAASQLDGVFSFCLLDVKNRLVHIARDTFGVRPSFKLTDSKGFLAVCSEVKGLIGLTEGLNGNYNINPIQPGHYETYRLHEDGTVEFAKSAAFHAIGAIPRYRTLVPQESLPENDISANIRTLLTAAVRKRLMAHRRIGCMLSGGLDSSLIAALLVQEAKEAKLPYKIQTFAIGMGEDSPDIQAARIVAKHIGSEHHEIIFTPEDVFNVLEELIDQLETFDITTIRASIGMYLISRYIKKETDSTVIFSGEGSDELTQGYIYFRDAPSAEEGDKDSRRLLEELHYFDVLRADRTTAGHGLELRVPFLDHQFTTYYLSLPSEIRTPKENVEKYLLRSAFDGIGLLPDDILWRPKEAFSDGVASIKKSLFVYIQEFIADKVNAEDLNEAEVTYPHVPPTSKESLYYRQVFERKYPGQEKLVPHIWLPKWRPGITDPSARFLPHYSGKN